MADVEETFLQDIAFTNDMQVSPSGDLQAVTGFANIKQQLLHRLITQPGALVHRPNYGVGVKDFQNALNSISNQRALALRIEEQFKEDIRVNDVLNVSVDSRDDRPELVVIKIKVLLVGLGEVDLSFKPFGSEELV